MAARLTMAAILAHLRRLIGDPAGANQIFSDDSLQTFAEEQSSVVSRHRLTPIRTFEGGAAVHKRFVARAGWWEGSPVTALKKADGVSVTPDRADLQFGAWEFNLDMSASEPLYVGGRTVEMYLAAADLLEAWGAKLKLQTDLSVEGLDLSRAQKFDQLQELAKIYRSHSPLFGDGTLEE